MLVITSHANTDFDALASMVAASFLYSEGVRVLPSQLTAPVREFVAVHWDLLRLKARKNTDLAEISGLVVTDTSNWERLDGMQELAERPGLNPVVWDHHMGHGSIVAAKMHQEDVGAVTTLLVERMQALDCAFSPVHATLFLLGIYEDTGSLSFPSTTARDASMAAFMLENGADLNVVSAYLESSLDARHLDLFTRMLEDAEIFSLGSLQLGICVQDVEKGLNMLPSVVNKFKDIKGLDAAFGIFPMSRSKAAVIGRGRGRDFDVGAAMRQLGGGGHPGAGSALVHGSMKEVRSQVWDVLYSTEVKETRVQDLMTTARDVLGPEDSLYKAQEVMHRTHRHALLIVDEQGKLLGMLGEKQLAKVRNEREWEKPVTSMLKTKVAVAGGNDSVRQALHLMSHSEAGFLPVLQDGKLVGEITRADIILFMYEF
ncbi:MAG: CBS domain-containing protein [Desulfovermiculus sp.]